MYCNKCGKENLDSNQYCINCGNKIKKYDISNLSIEKNTINFCNKCGAKISNNYCSQCGNRGNEYKIVEKDNSMDIKGIKTGINNLFDKDKFSFQNIKKFFLENKKTWKEAFIGAGLAFVIGLILCLISNVIFLKNIELFSNNKEFAELLNDDKNRNIFIDILQIYQISMQIPLNIIYENNEIIELFMKASVKVAYIILFIVPIISFLVGSYKKYKENTSTKENLKYYAATSFIFSILSNLIFVISYKLYSLKFDDIKYSSPLIKGIIITFLITLSIQLFLSVFIKKEKILDIFPYDSVEAFITIVKYQIIYSGLLTAIIYVFIIGGILTSSEFKATQLLNILYFIPNMWLYFALGIFGNEFVTVSEDGFQKIGVFNFAKENLSNPYIIIGLKFLIILGTIIVLYLGFKKHRSKKDLRNISITAVLLLVWNFILSLLTKTYIYLKGDIGGLGNIFSIDDMVEASSDMKMMIKIGYSYLGVLINTFIWCAIFAIVIYFVIDKIHIEKLEERLQKQRYVYIGGYIILFFIMFLLGFEDIIKEKSIIFDNTTTSRKSTVFLDYENDKDYKSNNIYMNIEEIERVLLGGKNIYFIQTYDTVYKYEPSKNKISDIYVSDGEIMYIAISEDSKKLAIQEETYEGNKIVIINENGEELNEKKFEDIINFRWNKNGDKLLVEGSTNQIMFPENIDNELLEIEGKNLFWNDNDTIAFLDDEKVYIYNYETKDKKDTGKEADMLLYGLSKVIVASNTDDEDSDKNILINSLDGEISDAIAADIFAYFVDDNNNKCIIRYRLETDNTILEIYSKDKKVNMKNNHLKIHHISNDGLVILSKEYDHNVLLYNINTGEWENITMNLRYTLDNMKEGDDSE
ncbi:zinc ribbon domain-containing protein [Defluviitalea phaphyphila]|uniref:zinc ribbon domain-containing protein n=1 Tax=Defluviitalea phaphyphila TaxID=1473580 RepID=UPI000730DF17|nr:zinc ribbon domain-containing protein [Defluviitalea phaphyphila]